MDNVPNDFPDIRTDLLADFHAYHAACGKLWELEQLNTRRLDWIKTISQLINVIQVINDAEQRHSQTLKELNNLRRTAKQKHVPFSSSRSSGLRPVAVRAGKTAVKSSLSTNTPIKAFPSKTSTPVSARVTTPSSVRKTLLKATNTPQSVSAKTRSIFEDDDDNEDDALPDLKTVVRPKIQLKRKNLETSAHDSSPSIQTDDEFTSPIYKRIKQTQERNSVSLKAPAPIGISPLKRRNENLKSGIFGR
ncbi:hypothetical protein KL910_001807 [Ogataea haglerorum]|nr:hypothetical protein KL910_001807 [Ogataea haglerorum]KAG7792426.1 hypothetical protein KL945_000707 [Ogataea haglerorum]